MEGERSEILREKEKVTTKVTMWHEVEMKILFPQEGGLSLISLNLTVFFVCIAMFMMLCL